MHFCGMWLIFRVSLCNDIETPQCLLNALESDELCKSIGSGLQDRFRIHNLIKSSHTQICHHSISQMQCISSHRTVYGLICSESCIVNMLLPENHQHQKKVSSCNFPESVFLHYCKYKAWITKQKSPWAEEPSLPAYSRLLHGPVYPKCTGISFCPLVTCVYFFRQSAKCGGHIVHSQL